MIAQVMENAIREFASVIQDGMERPALRKTALEIALETVNVQMEYVNAIRTSKEKLAVNLK